MPVIIAEDGNKRQHRQALHKLLTTSTGPLRIASAYVTDTTLLTGVKRRKVHLLTSLTRMDVISGATSLGALRTLVKGGVECRSFADGPRMHAKVYLFGGRTAVVTSANLTASAFDSNIEVGVQVGGKNVEELANWFDSLWKMATPVGLAEISKLEQQTDALRREYAALRRKTGRGPRSPVEAAPSVRSAASLRELLDNAPHFFICNTNRKYSSDLESRMKERKYAAVWEKFKYRTHMERVEEGHAIFMFAKGVGIVGVGRAAAAPEILGSRDPGRIRSPREWHGREWRVPVTDWLVWAEDADAFPYTIPNVSFVDVSGPKYDDLRRDIRDWFA